MQGGRDNEIGRGRKESERKNYVKVESARPAMEIMKIRTTDDKANEEVGYTYTLHSAQHAQYDLLAVAALTCFHRVDELVGREAGGLTAQFGLKLSSEINTNLNKLSYFRERERGRERQREREGERE